MPFIVPFIPLIAAGVGAAGTADAIYNQVNAPSAPQQTTTPTTPAAPQPQTQAVSQAQKTAVGSALPNLQSLTGGSLSPEYASQWAGGATGLNNDPQASGNIQAAINQFFGLSAPGQTGLAPSGGASPQGNSITDLLARVTAGGGVGGGGGATTGGIVDDALKGFS